MIIQDSKANIEKYLSTRAARDKAIKLVEDLKKKHPDLGLHMWLVKTPEGYMATGHDAIYMSELLKKKPMNYHQNNIGRTIQLLIIPEDQIKNACAIIKTYCETLVICDPEKDPISIVTERP